MIPIVDEYEIMQDALDDGVALSFNRMFKYREVPDNAEAILSLIENNDVRQEFAKNLMDSICEKFSFEDNV